MQNKRILITGVSGFVGRHLARYLHKQGRDILGTSRSCRHASLPSWIKCINFSIEDGSEIEDVLPGCDSVVHLAGRVHQLNEKGEHLTEIYKSINVDAPLKLARQAAEAGVKRFVFLSTIKVNGEKTTSVPFSACDFPSPEGAYAESKLAAEKGLLEIGSGKKIEIVVIRPPLIYGKGAKGNIRRLLEIIKKGIPLPLGSIKNKRDLVSIENLCDLIAVCLDHPRAPGQVFLVSDGHPITTADIIRFLALGAGVKVRLFPFPVSLLRIAACLCNKKDFMNRLCDSLQVDTCMTEEVLGWKPKAPKIL
ncbi:MAG: NAD-dependent epimerase/dehydratase family protein [Desulfobulbaceae bacterium]|nr:NAD-dependent epimerase/dehydratase family protein [Desulfobulbaceae bacterium]